VIIDQLNQSWTGVLQFLNGIVVPDWGGLVNLLPIFVVIGVVGPILTLLAFFWFAYLVQKPRLRTTMADHRRRAPLDADGNPVFPPGEPYSPQEQVIYEAGTVRSDSGEALVLACPKCGLVRAAAIDTCGNCGLSFTLRTSTISLRPAGPPPGGSAAA
jgi:hypothetical protein